MAAVSNNANRKSYFLTVTPVEYSLTSGTDIPPPQDDQPKYTEPPTPGGGPLTSHPSHPATPERTPSLNRTTSEANKENVDKKAEESNRERADSFRTPTSPASAANTASPQDKRPKGVKKLLSLSNLRSSFSSSRTSLSLPRQSNDAASQRTGTKRPSSPSMASTTPSSIQPKQQLRQKKSGGNWFKRKSSLLMLNGDGPGLDTLEESRPDTRESKRLKESSPAPLLPEVGTLGGGTFDNGDLGWDSTRFKRQI